MKEKVLLLICSIVKPNSTFLYDILSWFNTLTIAYEKRILGKKYIEKQTNKQSRKDKNKLARL